MKEIDNFKVTKENYKELEGKIIKGYLLTGKEYYKVKSITFSEKYGYCLADVSNIILYKNNSVFVKRIEIEIHLTSTHRIVKEVEAIEAIDNVANNLKELIK